MKEGAIDFETVLDLCRDPHRRIVLAVLEEEQRSLTVNDLTRTIVKYNHHRPITEVPEEELMRIQISLYHVHIPKIEMEGVIEHDRERQRVEPTGRFDQLQPHLSAILDFDAGIEEPVTL